MDTLALSRWQFALTTIYHFFFVPLTLGLSILVAIMETLYVTSGNEVYKRMTKFWGKLLLINFAMGVVTGIVQEFQFGMNWSEYSRYVGDIFGAPLAIEALLAFFLESTFLGVWLFGWERLSKGLHAAAIWLVAIGANISALWILIANSFMQQPVGYFIENGRAQLQDFAAVALNPNIWSQFPHVLSSGLVTGSFFVLGISAYHLLHKNDIDFFRRSFQLAAVIGAAFALFIAINGHSQAQHMVETQPMKMAAAEALWETESPASFSLLTIGDLSGEKEVFAIRLPRLLSLLAYNQLNGTIRGMNDLQKEYEAKYGPGDYIPPTIVTYWTFRIMVGAGVLMILLGLYALFVVMGEMTERSRLLLKVLPWAIVLPYLANTSGWLLTEVGRFPWVVYGLVKLEAGVSTRVTPLEAWISLVGYVLVYSLLIIPTVYLFFKVAKAGLVTKEVSEKASEGMPSLVGLPK
jgi:cytochrome d ubiquinol oxidase subunit I